MKEKANIWLAAENLSVGGYVEYLKCIECGNKTFHLKLNAENDSNYMGVIGLTDKAKNRLVITHLNEQELYNWTNEQGKKIEKRINIIFNSKEFEFINWDYFIDTVKKEKIYRPKCSKCLKYLEQTKVITLNEFINDGGQIIAIDIYQKK